MSGKFCPHCGGSGDVIYMLEDEKVEWEPCYPCNGVGWVTESWQWKAYHDKKKVSFLDVIKLVENRHASKHF